MEVAKMNETIQEAQIASTGLAPPKRKRGRPRKTHLLYPGEETLVPVQLEGKKKTRRKKSDSSLSLFSENAFVGQEVHGVLDGSFDAGYLLTVRVGDTDTVLRGVVFEPGSSVPISKANDIAPNVKMTRRDENTVAISSTSVPSLTNSAPVMNAQGTTSVSIPMQSLPPINFGSEQPGVVSLHPNGSPPKSVLHSSHVNEHSAPKMAIPVSQLQHHVSSPTKSFPYLQQPISSPSESASHLQQSTCTPPVPVSHQQQATPIPVEPSSHQLQPIPTPESVSHAHQPIHPCAEPKSQLQQPITCPPEPVGLQMNFKRE